MIFPSRFLGLLVLLGSFLWLSVHFANFRETSDNSAQAKNSPPIVHFTDVTQKAGLTAPIIVGGENTKKYIIETTGTGVAIFDYDNDGWLDIFVVNGTK